MGKTFGKWLRDQRMARGMTQGELEQKAALTYSQVSKYERGVLRLPTEEVRERIHAALGTSEEDLVNDKVLHRLHAGGHSFLVPSSEADLTQVEPSYVDAPAYSGEIDLDTVMQEIKDVAEDVAWTQNMVDTVVKQIEMFGKLQGKG